MKIISYGALCAICLAQATLARAELSFHLNTSSTNIESNPPSVSKPAYTKYASVSFLQSETKLDFKSGEIDVKTQCASMGYVIPVSKCTGVMKPSRLCSAESSMKSVAGADGYTTGCCNSNLYTALSPDACTNNSTSLNDFCYYDGSKKYRCSCDRARYPYSNSDNTTCGMGGEFDVSDVCIAPNAQGQNINYYSGCCPNSYQECDANNHEVGLGKSCRVQNSKGVVAKYESCTCASHYDTICSDGKLINVDNVCKRNGLNYTTESNCESLCTKTSETNIDDYLYGNVWHCLYENDGATLKETDEELKGKLCRGISVAGENMGTYVDKAFNDCEAQGYTKSEADCFGADDASGVYTILRCPNDTSKVWCLDSKYCTGYEVYQIGKNKACNAGANISACLNYDSTKGERCKYKETTYKDDNGNTVTTDCNSCWRDGVYVGNCQNYDDSDKGDSNHCCKLGYKMVNGICTPNVCSTQKDNGGNLLYPYRKHPGNDQGTVVKCYEAANNDLGYDVYFGYESCNSDVTKGGLWKAADDNPHRCVCDRTREGRYLPFDADLFFTSNSDTTDDYKYVGYGSGIYGVQNSCTDSEGTYYGYASCYIAYGEGTTASSYGMCLGASKSKSDRYYPYFDYYAYVQKVITGTGEAFNVPVYTTNPDEAYCIAQYKHCRSRDGLQVLGDEEVCNLVPKDSKGNPICLTGVESGCTECYHISNLTQDSNGKYILHHKFLVEMATTLRESSKRFWFGFAQCPAGYIAGVNNWRSCFKRCNINNLSACNMGDILQVGTDDVGIVYDASGKVSVMALAKISGTWAQAKEYAAGYYPQPVGGDDKYKTHALVGQGKWQLPKYEFFERSNYHMGGTAAYLGTNFTLTSVWVDEQDGEKFYFSSGSMKMYTNATAQNFGIPVLYLNY